MSKVIGFKCVSACVPLIGLAYAASNAEASVISPPATPVTDYYNLGNPATFPSSSPSLGTDGYYFPATENTAGTSTGVAAALPSYVSSIAFTNTTSIVSSTSYSVLDLPTLGASHIGGGFNNTISTGTLAFAEIQLSSSAPIPSMIQLGILGDNTANAGNQTNFTVSDSQGAVPFTVADTVEGAMQNVFYLVDITGATAGDLITVSVSKGAHESSGQVELGGFSFDSTPEPTSIGFVAAAGLATLVRRRRAVVGK